MIKETEVGLVAHLSESFSSEQRGDLRRTLRLEVEGTRDDSRVAPLNIHDLSATGLLAQTSEPPLVGERLYVQLPDEGCYAAKVVWSSGSFVGCAFDTPLPRAAISAALLRSIQPGTKLPTEAEGASSPVQELQARVDDMLRRTVEPRSKASLEQQGDHIEDRLPLHVRGRILVGLGVVSAGIWALALWSVGLI
jgi:hypothetical protein